MLLSFFATQANAFDGELVKREICDTLKSSDNFISPHANRFCLDGFQMQMCYGSRERPVEECNVTELSDTSVVVNFEYNNYFLGRNSKIYSEAKGNIKCLFNSFYTWECLYLSNESYSTSTTDTRYSYSERSQEGYLSDLSDYLNENL